MNFNPEQFKSKFNDLIAQARDAKSVEDLRVRCLGRKGELTAVLRSLKDLDLEEKRKFGPVVQNLKQELGKLFDEKILKLASGGRKNFVDISMPGKKIAAGHLHLLATIEKEVREIFKAMNFSVVEGPEVESEYYNFDALNIPKNHPAREMWDTFWLKTQTSADLMRTKTESRSKNQRESALLLRTHTSPVQIRYMETHKPPFQIITPGRVYRFEATDASHETNFNQVEGLMVGKDISLANFKYVIQEFFSRLFGKKLNIRLRPSYFPFVEPGLEVDVECVKCGGKGCNVCKNSGWLEIMGAGMVHPKVFEAVHYNPREYRGFAFGLGLERAAMIKYGIPDIRLFYSGDLRFIKQF